jgi:hypothetical protein
MKTYEINITVVVEAESENDAQARIEDVIFIGMDYATDMEYRGMTVTEIG